MTEKEWIDFLKSYLFEDFPVLKSKNEDCAVIKLAERDYLLLTTDALVEQVHFQWEYTSFYDLGVKLAVSNLSDIAATGGIPNFALLTLGSSKPLETFWLEPFMEGLTSTLERYGTKLIGGDTVKSSVFFVNLVVMGRTKNPLLRKGAQVGDYIFVSRKLGESVAFLREIKKLPLEQIPENLKKAHLRPEPEIELGKELSYQELATSVIDISDGLLLDLWRICKENEVGAEIWKEKIPVGLYATLEEALSGGEDYALLFTVKEENLKKLENLGLRLNRTFFKIGKIIKEKKLYLLEGDLKREIKPLGFNHFEED
ncbi:MAG: thiamine-phosphate kinase [Thermodesulfobacteriaceae bacterium]|nr:thiamine-phosphate kinase [Thermodesulfobacteriaceae bacterium]MDW8136068.1 thiamine-phosphate kinase [Thermodesulfobacterium sp.]